MIDRKSAIRRQFNRSAAGSYDAHAHVQRIMAHKLSNSLESWRREGDNDAPRILEIGCGTGMLTEIMVNDWPNSSITAIDIAPAMIAAAERRVRTSFAEGSAHGERRSSRVRFLHADVEAWSASASPSSFDLIVSSACFQWLNRPKQTLENLRRMLSPGGLIAFATFGPETFRELHASFDAVYRANGNNPERHGLSFQSADQWGSLLKETRFSTIRCERLVHTETHASAREFLHSVKALGASASEAAASRGFGSRRLIAGMYEEYERSFSLPGGVAATYEALFVAARKIDPPANPGFEK
ncbi:malonyl-ACP O-methyltransferase BioC [Cohnella suwonensis]|uniref:Malonyl-[acyl-carrier protein] O-methyltransferase n=1 Tax=Cohnella suwonensis TaxID=696072 RepID=A0ABW0M0K9_9BACL